MVLLLRGGKGQEKKGGIGRGGEWTGGEGERKGREGNKEREWKDHCSLNLTVCIRPWLGACITTGVRTMHFNLICVLCLRYHDDQDDDMPMQVEACCVSLYVQLSTYHLEYNRRALGKAWTLGARSTAYSSHSKANAATWRSATINTSSMFVRSTVAAMPPAKR